MKNRNTNNSRTRSRFAACSSMLFALVLSCSSSGKEDAGIQEEPGSWTVTVGGKVGFPQEGQIVIQELKEGGGWQDTIQLKSDYTFAKQVTMREPGYYRLNFYNRQVVTVILHRDNIDVTVDGNSQQGYAKISGSTDLDLIDRVRGLQEKINSDPVMVQLNEDFTAAAQRRDEKTMQDLQQTYMQHLKKINDQIAVMMVEESPSLAVINLLQSDILDRDQYFDTYSQVAKTLEKEWPDYAVADNFVIYVDKMKKLAVGQPAPEIELPDPDGKVVPLSSMKGKYVLVDFWAKWCGPCRRENPNVVAAYQKYKDKGFTVYGVSLDRSREDWLSAIKQDNLTWTHVSDLKYWQSEAAKTYDITAIPFSLLLDPDGVIVAKNLRGVALQQKLEEIFR